MKRWNILYLLILTFVGLYVAPVVDRKEKQEMDDFLDIDQEYFRYLINVVKVLGQEPAYIERSETMSEEDIKAGKLTDGLMLILSSDVKEKLNRLKKEEVEYQRKLLADNKNHVTSVHYDDKETFGQDDLTKLLSRFNDIGALWDEKRRREFKDYEMNKELKHREDMKHKTEEERAEEDRKYKLHHEKKHEKMHEPGHKAQMEEVWEKGDGLDAEAFEYKTFFNLHDKNSDGYLDKYELETLFLQDLDKVYNETDPDTDPTEREEEMERMREYATKSMDLNNDGLVSQREFFKEIQDYDFNTDKEWTPLTETSQFTEKELEDFTSASYGNRTIH